MEHHSLRRNSIGVVGIVFIVVAAASPFAAIIGNTPLGFALGDGAGLPGAFVLSGILLACFALGFTAMSPYVQNAAAFYAYIRAGLGRRAGQAAALVALLGYNALTAGLVGYMGYFGQSVFVDELNAHAPWELYAFGSLALCLVLGLSGIDVGVKVLGLLLVLEGILIVAAALVTFVTHADPLVLTSFTPGAVMQGAPGVALMFALLSYIGFEGTAIFAEEARNPRKTIRRATLVAISVITAVYTLATLSAVAFYGVANVGRAASREPGTFYSAIVADALGPWSGHLVGMLLLTSLFATLLAIHNMAARYFYGLARDGLLPRRLDRISDRGAPVAACAVQALVTALIVAAYALGGQHPYLNLATTMFGLGTVAIVALQATTGISVIAFFLRRRDSSAGRLVTFVAPLIGSVGLAWTCSMVISNFSTLTGTTSHLVNALPWLIVAVALAGAMLPGHPDDTAVSPDLTSNQHQVDDLRT
ncbi:APC family permease [Streptomyces chartreusis]|uniref:APC family permease n=1 Tax=Streptomyces chartreusis TaxID=1969 RepID=A0A7H8T2H9_STRCX|nr:APC family permease [Streptomyces chartreusis]QKZ17584.1 APC family permease [Streptomyces chartreusis]